MKGNKIRGVITLMLVILCPIVLGVVCAGAVFGWYTHIEQVGELHGDTSNVNLHYYINDSDKLNPTTVTVRYITFFDIDAPKETRFLNDMCNEIKLDITNKASSDASLSVKFEATKVTKTEGGNVVSRAYVGALGGFGATAISGTIGQDTTIVSKMVTSVTNGVGFTYTNTDTTFSCEYTCELAKDASLVNPLKFFLFGVQDIDDAALADFYYAEGSTTETRDYVCTITLKSVNKGAPDIEDITTTAEE